MLCGLGTNAFLTDKAIRIPISMPQTANAALRKSLFRRGAGVAEGGEGVTSTGISGVCGGGRISTLSAEGSGGLSSRIIRR